MVTPVPFTLTLTGSALLAVAQESGVARRARYLANLQTAMDAHQASSDV